LPSAAAAAAVAGPRLENSIGKVTGKQSSEGSQRLRVSGCFGEGRRGERARGHAEAEEGRLQKPAI
jgi:hypothetical protein